MPDKKTNGIHPVRKYPRSPLTDGEIDLRPWDVADIPRIAAACSDHQTSHYTLVPSPYTEIDAREWLESLPLQLTTGKSIAFAIDAAGLMVGSVGFVEFDWRQRRANIGYWLHPDSRGMGLATRAVSLTCAWGFEELGLERIDAHVEKDHLGSHGVLTRNRFSKESQARSTISNKGVRIDMVTFTLLKP